MANMPAAAAVVKGIWTVQANTVAAGKVMPSFKPAEAAVPLQRALAARECDDALRADLVATLMAAGELDKARAAVDPPARCQKQEGGHAP